MILEALVAVHDLGRLREIATVLIKHGFGDFVQRTGVRQALARAGRALHLRSGPPPVGIATATRARQALEELGPTFVKLGQLLASRPDVLPPDWIEELSKLHAQVTTVPIERVRAQLEADLGGPPEQVFRDFDPTPIAAGSIAQVYAARTADDRRIVIKVRRPDIADRVRADLRLLARVAQVLAQEDGELRRFRPQQIVRDFARTMRAELDLRIEARNLERLARNLRGRGDVALPYVVGEFTRESTLVMTRLDGVSAAQWLTSGRAASAQFDPRQVARCGADIVLQMVFSDGTFHADPHPGNLLFLPDGRIGLLDFGQVGHLSSRRRLELLRLLGAVVQRDEEAAVDVLLGWSDTSDIDIAELGADVRAFLDRYYATPLEDLDVAQMLLDVAELVRDNDLSLPAEIALLIKVFLTLQGLGSALDPEFDFAARIEPAARRLLSTTMSPRAIVRRNLRDARSLALSLPNDLRTLFTRVRRGQFRLQMDLQRLEQFGRQIDRSANRLTVGMITAALIIGTSIAMATDRGPSLLGWPVLGLFGFLCSAGVGVVLLWSILRSGRG